MRPRTRSRGSIFVRCCALLAALAGCSEDDADAGPSSSGAPDCGSDPSLPGCGGGASGGSGASSGTGGVSSTGAGGGGGSGAGGGSGSCALPSYPDASCTGVPDGTTLTVVEGDMEIDVPDTVIDGMDIRGCVSINAPGVIIRNSKITCTSFLAVASYAGSYTGAGALLEDVEISCDDQQGTAVGDYNVTVRRADIHSCENGFDVDGLITVEDSFIHDLLPYDAATDPHVDGLQITPVGQTITIRHNTIYAGTDGNAAIISPNVSAGVVSDVLIQDNLLAGGGYTLYCQQDGSGNDYRVVDNHFSTVFHADVGAFGPWTECEDETEVTGNVIHETNEPVPF